MLLGENNPSYYYYLYFISTNFIILTLLINSIFLCDILHAPSTLSTSFPFCKGETGKELKSCQSFTFSTLSPKNTYIIFVLTQKVGERGRKFLIVFNGRVKAWYSRH